MKKLYTIILLLIGININTNAQIVNIPDTNFYKALLANGVHDSAGYITVDTAKAFKGILSMESSGITDLSGIEAFTAITYLDCGGDALTSIDLSANVNLDTLLLDGNGLTSLDVSHNTALTSLDCSSNYLINLNLSSNVALIFLNCSLNSLTSLNLSSNTTLAILYCGNNSLSSLNLSSNIALAKLSCPFNNITSLNLSSNTALTFLICSFNNLTNLDVSANATLTVLFCDDDSLTSLNVKNGNNHNMLGSNFSALGNRLLTCVQVDDSAYSTANWQHIDSTAHFSTDCNYVGINELTAVTDINIYPNPVSSQLIIESKGQRVLSVIIYNTLGQIVNTKKITGNEAIIDMNGEPSGIYYIRITTDGGRTINKKIVKQ